MLLYRGIGEKELKVLLKEAVVYGKFDCSNEKQNDSTLKNAVCFFGDEFVWHDKSEHIFAVVIDVPIAEFKYVGEGTYYTSSNTLKNKYWTGRTGKTEIKLNEVYLEKYSIKDVKKIYLANYYTNSFIVESINPILKKYDIEHIENLSDFLQFNDNMNCNFIDEYHRQLNLSNLYNTETRKIITDFAYSVIKDYDFSLLSQDMSFNEYQDCLLDERFRLIPELTETIKSNMAKSDNIRAQSIYLNCDLISLNKRIRDILIYILSRLDFYNGYNFCYDDNCCVQTLEETVKVSGIKIYTFIPTIENPLDLNIQENNMFYEKLECFELKTFDSEDLNCATEDTYIFHSKMFVPTRVNPSYKECFKINDIASLISFIRSEQFVLLNSRKEYENLLFASKLDILSENDIIDKITSYIDSYIVVDSELYYCL